MRALALLVVLAFLAIVFAGCAGPKPGPVVLLRESEEVGADLYAWGDDYYSDRGLESVKRRIRADFDVTPDVATLGIRFAGRLVWENATINFTLQDPEGDPAVFLPAAFGKPDDFGDISGYFQFERTIPARNGNWDIVVEGRNKIGQVDFQVWGIEKRETAVQRYFDIDDKGRDVKIVAILEGWGRTPRISLTYPNGTIEPLALDASHEQAIHTFAAPQTGRYAIRVDTTGWGGRVALLADHPE